MALIILAILVLGITVAYVLLTSFGKSEVDLSVYEIKPYIFDTNSEFQLYKSLLELYGDKYFIFPEVNYSHLIQPKKSNWREERRNRSRIDRKSADFVFCDKEKIIPKLVIELDGYVHNFKSKQARDELINEILKIVDLPILHLTTNNLDRDFIKNEINKKLNI